jgi:hypothetical protein
LSPLQTQKCDSFTRSNEGIQEVSLRSWISAYLGTTN